MMKHVNNDNEKIEEKQENNLAKLNCMEEVKLKKKRINASKVNQ